MNRRQRRAATKEIRKEQKRQRRQRDAQVRKIGISLGSYLKMRRQRAS